MKSWVRDEHPECFSEAQKAAEFIFPELRESEDEKIRKEICDFICWARDRGSITMEQRENVDSWIAWLEKQNHDGKKWIYEDVYFKEKEEIYQDGVDDVLENPQKYGLEKQDEQKPSWSEGDSAMLEETLYFINEYQKSNRCTNENDMQNSVTCENWLKSLKDKIE